MATVVCMFVGGLATAATNEIQRAAITSLTVTGSPATPVFTIRGRDLEVPRPNPKSPPARQPMCPLKTTGKVGHDYGTNFYVIAWDGQATSSNALLYSAGRYRPTLNELDCIGIVPVSHTPTKVVFRFGHAYSQFSSQYRPLTNGDVVKVVLNQTARATVVHYHGH
jgi:hypothetical protein